MRYEIVANSGTKEITSDALTFEMERLDSQLSANQLGSGATDHLTVSNDSGVDIDLSGSEFTPSDESLQLHDNTCYGILRNGSSCNVKVTALSSATSNNTEISMTNKSGVILLSLIHI